MCAFHIRLRLLSIHVNSDLVIFNQNHFNMTEENFTDVNMDRGSTELLCPVNHQFCYCNEVHAVWFVGGVHMVCRNVDKDPDDIFTASMHFLAFK